MGTISDDFSFSSQLKCHFLTLPKRHSRCRFSFGKEDKNETAIFFSAWVVKRIWLLSFFFYRRYSVEFAKGAASVYVLAPSSLSSIYMP